MAAQKKYEPLVPLSEVAFRIATGCLLCQNVLQGIDAASMPSKVANNIMLDLGNSFIVPNRYPSLPLHMLWLPKNHDDLETRIDQHRIPVEQDSKDTVLYLPTEHGKTRDSLVSADDLAQIFHLCRSMDLIAGRNHTLSGKSLGWHDHWHLLPIQCYPKDFFETLAFGKDTVGDQVFRAKGTPFDVLVMQDHNAEVLAERVTKLINELESSNQVFCPTFIPTNNGFALVAPLHRNEVNDRYVQIGGAVLHGWSSADKELNARVRRYVPLNNKFDWNSQMPEVELLQDRSYSPDKIHKLHPPINYRVYQSWGSGDAIWDNMTQFARNVYTEVHDLQDKRGDLGHVDTVVYFTNRLARLMGLTPDEREATVLAAILHDVGWSQIPNINEVFSALITRMKSDDGEDRALASAEMVKLRVLHQEEAVKIAAEVLGDHPYTEQICRAIGDHDTRYHKPEAIFRAFLDADWLWRVTLTQLQANTAGVFDRKDPEQVQQFLLSYAKPDDFFLPWAYQIARIETINTLREAHRVYKWGELPKDFEQTFREELASQSSTSSSES